MGPVLKYLELSPFFYFDIIPIQRLMNLKIALSISIIAMTLLSSCMGTAPFTNSTSYSGNVIVTTIATDPATGPGLVTMYNSSGAVVSLLRDLYSTGEWASGSAFVAPYTIVTSIQGTTRLELTDIRTNSIASIVSVSLTSAPIRQVAVDGAGSMWVVESAVAQQDVEKFTASGQRVGNPFIPTTVGACVLATPWGITYMPNTGYIAVISAAAAGRLSVYDTNGNCINHVTAAPLNAGTPTGVAYHPTTGMLIITFATTHAIWAMNYDGSGATQIFLNSSIINTPKAVAADAQGNIYVGSNGTNSVEKLYWSGTGTATRVLSGPFAGPGAYTQRPTSITVIP